MWILLNFWLNFLHIYLFWLHILLQQPFAIRLLDNFLNCLLVWVFLRKVHFRKMVWLLILLKNKLGFSLNQSLLLRFTLQLHLWASELFINVLFRNSFGGVGWNISVFISDLLKDVLHNMDFGFSLLKFGIFCYWSYLLKML